MECFLASIYNDGSGENQALTPLSLWERGRWRGHSGQVRNISK